MSGPVVQSLWIGNRLSAMEKAAIASFVANGHDYHLYCYEDVQGVPRGVTLKDGNAILPESRLFPYSDGFAKGSYAAVSNAFRYKLLLERGGWWVDTDVVCLRPFDLADERLWASERADPPRDLIVSTCVIKAPPGDPLMAWAWQRCQAVDVTKVTFGQLGPRLLQAGLDALGVHRYMRPHTFFCPIPFYEWARVLDPADQCLLGPEVYGIHLWNQMWSANGVDKNGVFPAGSLFERLKRRYLTTGSDAG
jgi:mannosyltransferase OCH1-like enzyme